MALKVNIRAGTYHNGIFNNDPDLLFDSLKGAYFKEIRVGDESYFYFLDKLIIENNELIGSLSRARKNKSIRTVSDTSNKILPELNKNLVDCSVMFYMDRENTFIVEEKKLIPRSKFTWALSNILYQFTDTNDEHHQRIYGREFNITFDRYTALKASDFLDRITALKKVELKSNSWENPYFTKQMEDLQKQFMAMKANKITITGNELDKDALMIRAASNLSEDGHLDVKIVGEDEDGEEITFSSNSNHDDLYRVENCKGDNKRFRDKISFIIHNVRKNHGKS